MSFYRTCPGITRPVVILPKDYRDRFVKQCVEELGLSALEAKIEFDEMVDMITEYIPTCGTPEAMASAWIAENARCA